MPGGPPDAAALAFVPRTTDENTGSYLAAVRLLRRALRQDAPSPAIDFEKQAVFGIRCRAFSPLPRTGANSPNRASPITSHFFTATPYPIAPPSSVIPAAPAVSENLHPDRPSIFHSLPTWPSRLRANSISPRQTAIETPPRFVARAAIPAAPLLLPHPSRAPAASSAGHPRSIRFSCLAGSPGRPPDLSAPSRSLLLSVR